MMLVKKKTRHAVLIPMFLTVEVFLHQRRLSVVLSPDTLNPKYCLSKQASHLVLRGFTHTARDFITYDAQQHRCYFVGRPMEAENPSNL